MSSAGPDMDELQDQETTVNDDQHLASEFDKDTVDTGMFGLLLTPTTRAAVMVAVITVVLGTPDHS